MVRTPRPESLHIRAACADEANLLTELAMRSKGHWGYSQQFLDDCRKELTVDPKSFGANGFHCVVAARGGVPVGFYCVQALSDCSYELEALFVEPEHIGTGVGGLLMQHACAMLSGQGATRLLIQGDPNAGDFYIAAGARRTGCRESGSIPGRYLPIFEIELGRR